MKVRVKFTDQAYGFDPQNNCYINALRKRYAVELSEDPDLVFYSCFGTEFLAYPRSVRIFLANEPILPNFNDCDYAIGAMDMQFGKRYFRQPPILNYGEYPYWKNMRSPWKPPEGAFERKFCNFVYSNEKNGSGAQLRIDFCRKLSKYRRVDCPGKVLNNMEGALTLRYPNGKIRSAADFNSGWAEDKLAFLRDYKFTIAFENTALPGFTSEKLIHPLMAHSVPIYWGDPLAAEYFNPKAFINCADYDNDYDKVVRRVMELDQDEEQYMEILCQPPLNETFPTQWEEKLANFLSDVVEGGCRPLEKNTAGYPSMSAQDYATLCREGKIGMSDILRRSAGAVGGWLQYKLRNRAGGRQA